MKRASWWIALAAASAAVAGCFGSSTGNPPAGANDSDASTDDAGDGDDGGCEDVPNCDMVIGGGELTADCVLVQPHCVNGVAGCQIWMCLDVDAEAGPPPDAAGDTGPAAPDAAPDAPVEEDAAIEASLPEASTLPEASAAFVCDSGDGSPIDCSGATPVCRIVEGGAAPGIHPPACIAIPGACTTTPTCTCIAAALGAGFSCAQSGDDFTVTQRVP
ncbi:MAG TPA: hypothetical protein VHV30_12940 [Polyangiaceae bacterium]|jgi:hypothetical protein|nr:hypothetical protein [Polyangiaceae bacterium]